VRERRGTREFAEPILAAAGLALHLADALDDDSWDVEIGRGAGEAFSLTGKDVGTPIIHFEPPARGGLFGPVISRLPREDSAVELWDYVAGLARFPGFAELGGACVSGHSWRHLAYRPARSVGRRTGTAEVGLLKK